jgi:hypothetical protein
MLTACRLTKLIYVPILIVSQTFSEIALPLYSPNYHLHNDTTLIQFRDIKLLLLIALPSRQRVLLTDPDSDNQNTNNIYITTMS